MNDVSILVVEDDNSQRLIMTGFLKKKGYRIYDSGNPLEALDIVKNQHIDIVLSDLRMPEMTGDELLVKVKDINPEIAFIILTAFGSVETAVKSIKNGAFDFLTKPVNLEHLGNKITQVVRFKALKKENQSLKEALNTDKSFQSIVSQSPNMEEVLSIASRSAGSAASVLILGESGTGKELIARAIHAASPRKDQPFVAVNCAALAEGVLESELFGHEKGAFTGAANRRLGRFEQANAGTLFLDEIGDIPMNIQVKLLRTIQEGIIERVGGNESVKVDVRLLAATHRNLLERIENNLFRDDLYYRLNVVSLTIPPLRERKTDIPLLISNFLDHFVAKYNREQMTVSAAARDKLMKYDFPGNVRELQNILERAVVLCRGSEIMPEDLNLSAQTEEEEDISAEGGYLDQLVAELEIREIRNALQQNRYNQSAAGRQLGMSERKLRYKIKKYNINE